MISGSDVVLCDGDQLIDVMRRGQGVLNILPIGGVKDHLDACAPSVHHPHHRHHRSPVGSPADRSWAPRVAHRAW
ncbi:MAG: hypothetical protein R2713_16555 [Ilumatobacteraceae bacterium]